MWRISSRRAAAVSGRSVKSMKRRSCTIWSKIHRKRYDIAALHPDQIEKLKAIGEQHRQSIEPVESQLIKR